MTVLAVDLEVVLTFDRKVVSVETLDAVVVFTFDVVVVSVTTGTITVFVTS